MFSAHAGTSATVPPVVERNPHRRALATALARSELASHTLAWRKLRRALPVQQALAVLWDVMRMQVRGEPFSHLGHPEDERDRLSRRQIGPAILLYRSLRMRVDADQALALTREVVLSSGVVFLEALLADVDPREAAPTEDPKRKLESLAERFFNAEGELVLLGERSASFDVCRCRFVELLDAADARILGPLLCEVDASYFRQEFTTLRLSRTTTRMQNGERCDFRFTW